MPFRDASGVRRRGRLVAFVQVTLALGVLASARPAQAQCANGSFTSTYDALQAVIFEGRGCTQAGCHDPLTMHAGLALTSDVSYDLLVGVPSAIFVTVNRVEPGDPEASVLYDKLRAGTLGVPTVYGGGAMPDTGEPLSEDQLAAVALWIAADAPRDGNVAGTDALLGVCLPQNAPALGRVGILCGTALLGAAAAALLRGRACGAG